MPYTGWALAAQHVHDAVHQMLHHVHPSCKPRTSHSLFFNHLFVDKWSAREKSLHTHKMVTRNNVRKCKSFFTISITIVIVLKMIWKCPVREVHSQHRTSYVSIDRRCWAVLHSIHSLRLAIDMAESWNSTNAFSVQTVHPVNCFLLLFAKYFLPFLKSQSCDVCFSLQ